MKSKVLSYLKLFLPRCFRNPAIDVCVQRITKLVTPAPDWGPSQPEDRKRYLASCGFVDPESVVTLTEKPSPIYKPGSLEQMSLTKSTVWGGWGQEWEWTVRWKLLLWRTVLHWMKSQSIESLSTRHRPLQVVVMDVPGTSAVLADKRAAKWSAPCW